MATPAFSVPIPEADAERIVNAFTATPPQGTEAERIIQARHVIYGLIARELHLVERARSSLVPLTFE